MTGETKFDYIISVGARATGNDVRKNQLTSLGLGLFDNKSKYQNVAHRTFGNFNLKEECTWNPKFIPKNMEFYNEITDGKCSLSLDDGIRQFQTAIEDWQRIYKIKPGRALILINSNDDNFTHLVPILSKFNFPQLQILFNKTHTQLQIQSIINYFPWIDTDFLQSDYEYDPLITDYDPTLSALANGQFLLNLINGRHVKPVPHPKEIKDEPKKDLIIPVPHPKEIKDEPKKDLIIPVPCPIKLQKMARRKKLRIVGITVVVLAVVATPFIVAKLRRRKH
ncbi:MAG: hypothetical protein Edafosvirus1_67 [Edafosvirus sp.]|uniref:Uncharacterized protein n=1 Tax=Edafosvirus sp. TaxID=2487765 RepID=A0A3G4ZS63_9VIRU|nr:MAG: hypothetical protein Edafosvirus1_67 [Edafosvirus sp.]